MKSIYSQYTGNTRYVSDCGRFSSMNKKAVDCFEKTVPTGQSLTRRDWIYWNCAGYIDGPSIYMQEN